MAKRIMSEERAHYAAEALEENEPEKSESQIAYRNPIKQVGFAYIEHVLGLDTTLSDGAYRTYGVLLFYARQSHVTWVKRETIAKVRGLKASTISAHFDELKSKGLITRKRRMGRSALTYIEDLPKEYTDAAKLILADREKNRRNTSRKSDILHLENPRSEEESIEEESLKENMPAALSIEPEARPLPQGGSTPVVQDHVDASDDGKGGFKCGACLEYHLLADIHNLRTPAPCDFPVRDPDGLIVELSPALKLFKQYYPNFKKFEDSAQRKKWEKDEKEFDLKDFERAIMWTKTIANEKGGRGMSMAIAMKSVLTAVEKRAVPKFVPAEPPKVRFDPERAILRDAAHGGKT